MRKIVCALTLLVFIFTGCDSDSKFLIPTEINGKYGFIDEKSKVVLEPIYERAWEFSKNGVAVVQLNNKFGLINKKGKFIIEPKFDDMWEFSENGVAIVKLNDKIGFINEKGKFVIEPKLMVLAIFQKTA